MLSLIAPWFLYLLPLAALPVLFHFFLKLQKRIQPFPSLIFFLKVDPRMRARRRIRELLILLLRTLLLLLLLLFLAGPYLRGWGGGGRAAVMLVIDNSASMAGRSAAGGTSKCNAAINAAAAVLATLGTDDLAGVHLLVPDPTVTELSGLRSDRDAVRRILDTITPTDGAAAPGQALSAAMNALQASGIPDAEIHFFTDLQENEWGKALQLAQRPGAGVRIVVHRLVSESEAGGNVGVRNLILPKQRLVAGRPFAVWAELQNDSAEAVTVTLQVETDEGRTLSQSVTLSAHAVIRTPLTMTSAQPGRHWLRLRLEGDSFSGDNRMAIAWTCADRATVLFVGRDTQFALLPLALAPAGGSQTGLQPQFVPDTADLGAVTPPPAVVVTTWKALAAMPTASRDWIRAYLEGGGRAIVVPVRTTVDPVETPDWCAVKLLDRQVSGPGAAIAVLDRHNTLWDALRQDDGSLGMQAIRAYRYFPMELKDTAAEALLGDEAGHAVLIHRPIGAGHLYMSGVSFDMRWLNLPRQAAFLAVAHGMALGAADGDGSVLLNAGDAPPLPDVATSAASLTVHTITGSPLDWAGSPSEFAGFARAGVYDLSVGGVTKQIVVRPAAGEGTVSFLPPETIPALQGLTVQAHEARSAEAAGEFAARSRRGIDFTMPLVLLALAALLTEGILANMSDIKRIAAVGGVA